METITQHLQKYGKITITTEEYRSTKEPKPVSDRVKEYQAKYRDQIKLTAKENKQRAVDLFGGCCTKCGYSKCMKALHFHHIDPSTKKYKPSALFKKSWDFIVEELDKCVLLCANCHAEEHNE